MNLSSNWAFEGAVNASHPACGGNDVTSENAVSNDEKTRIAFTASRTNRIEGRFQETCGNVPGS